MENNHVEHKEERNSLHQMMQDTIDQIHGMADSNAVVGQPIHTPDGVTLIPISRVSFGFGNGGGSTYGKHQPNKENLTFATGGGVKMDPVAFLVIRDGVTRLLPVTMPPATTVDRIVELVPDLIDKAEKYFDKKKEKDF